MTTHFDSHPHPDHHPHPHPRYRRAAVLHSVLTVADRRRDGLLPLDVDGVLQTFADELDLIGALQLRWHARLTASIEGELASEPLDLEAAVAAAWRATAAAMPGVRAVLDRHLDAPLDDRMARALRTATDRERALLALASGRCAAGDDAASRIGARVEARARLRTPVAA